MGSTYKKVCHTKSRSLKSIIITDNDIEYYLSPENNSCVIIVNTSPQNINPVIEALKEYKEKEEQKEQIRIGMYVEDISEVIENRRKI